MRRFELRQAFRVVMRVVHLQVLARAGTQQPAEDHAHRSRDYEIVQHNHGDTARATAGSCGAVLVAAMRSCSSVAQVAATSRKPE